MSGPENPERRALLTKIAGVAMGAGVVAAYGGLGGIALRYLYPAEGREKAWLFVSQLAEFAVGDSLVYMAPDGSRVTVARQSESAGADASVALSTTCPHLGCNVHWEGQNNRFFCPCHNGVFSPDGVGTEGPPADAGQSLAAYPLRVDSGLLFIEVPVERLVGSNMIEVDPDYAPPGLGDDPRLAECTEA
ncbi:MAG: Rieske (2Fe-2S) protein [Proteobacteria bacterium]|nr:Rieske (2Fe-2S) protein [Pseudomonadota bacterium]MCP4918108.1 Rieske (2Fe-2S) protein [Pseudomonadota bacterium]